MSLILGLPLALMSILVFVEAAELEELILAYWYGAGAAILLVAAGMLWRGIKAGRAVFWVGVLGWGGATLALALPPMLYLHSR